MRLVIGIIIGFLISTAIVEARVFTKGGITMETGNILEPGGKVTEDDIAPINPNLGDIWRNIVDNDIRKFDGTDWIIVKKDTEADAWIASWKTNRQTAIDNFSNVPAGAVKNCLQALYNMEVLNGKLTLKLYKETLE